MRTVYTVLLFLFSFTAIGCGPKCLPLPEAKALISHSNKLPFRVCGVTVAFAPPSEQIKDKIWYTYKSFNDVEKVINETFYGSSIVNTTAPSAVTIDVFIKGLRVGSDAIWGQTPSFFAAKYIVRDMANRKVLLERTYEIEKGYNRESDLRCGLAANAYAALTRAVNTATNKFIDDLRTVSPSANQFENKNNIHGSLQFVYTEIPFTQRNLAWELQYHKHCRAFIFQYKTDLKSQLTYDVTRRIFDEKVFDGAVTPSYTIKIFVPRIEASPSSIFRSESSSAFYADAVIYKDGKEIDNVEFSPDEYDPYAAQHIITQQYVNKIIQKVNTLRSNQ